MLTYILTTEGQRGFLIQNYGNRSIERTVRDEDINLLYLRLKIEDRNLVRVKKSKKLVQKMRCEVWCLVVTKIDKNIPVT